MRILMLTPYLPYPPSSGGQVRSYNLIKQLYKKHDITLFCYIRDRREKKFVPELEKYCGKVKVFKRRRAWHPANILLSGLTLYPFLVAIYLSPAIRRAIARELAEESYDLIHSETFYVMPNIPKTTVPIFLVEQTIEYLVYQRFVESLSKFLLPLKLLLFLDVVKIRWWERFFWRKAERLAAMSEQDKDFMRRTEPSLKIDVIANGVDIDYFRKTEKKAANSTVLFVGQFKWLPNKDAAKFLVSSIWPLVKREYSRAKLLIVGRDPTSDILSLQGVEDVEVVGDLEDIRDAYSKADVLLAPIRNGRGTKYKILEAMATKTPIVGTRLAVEGIAVRHGKHVLIGDTAEKLANLTLRILKDRRQGRRLASEAFKLVGEKYNWKIISQRLDSVYMAVAEGRRDVVGG